MPLSFSASAVVCSTGVLQGGMTTLCFSLAGMTSARALSGSSPTVLGSSGPWPRKAAPMPSAMIRTAPTIHGILFFTD